MQQLSLSHFNVSAVKRLHRSLITFRTERYYIQGFITFRTKCYYIKDSYYIQDFNTCLLNYVYIFKEKLQVNHLWVLNGQNVSPEHHSAVRKIEEEVNLQFRTPTFHGQAMGYMAGSGYEIITLLENILTITATANAGNMRLDSKKRIDLNDR